MTATFCDIWEQSVGCYIVNSFRTDMLSAARQDILAPGEINLQCRNYGLRMNSLKFW